MLPVAGVVAVAVPGGAGDERDGARGDVRLLPAVRGGDTAAVEAAGDGLPDRAVRLQLLDFGLDAPAPLWRVGLRGDPGLVLQCGV